MEINFCVACGKHAPEDFGVYAGEDALCCLECWQEIESQREDYFDDKTRAPDQLTYGPAGMR